MEPSPNGNDTLDTRFTVAMFREQGGELVGKLVLFHVVQYVGHFECDASDAFGTARPLIRVVLRDPNPAGDTLADFFAEEGSLLARTLPMLLAGERIVCKGWVAMNPETGRPSVLLKGAAAIRPMV